VQQTNHVGIVGYANSIKPRAVQYVGIVGYALYMANNANNMRGAFCAGLLAVGYVGTLDSQFQSLAKYTYGFTLHSYFT
jgi:hypothetical protein